MAAILELVFMTVKCYRIWGGENYDEEMRIMVERFLDKEYKVVAFEQWVSLHFYIFIF